jgi:hypothetical protein
VAFLFASLGLPQQTPFARHAKQTEKVTELWGQEIIYILKRNTSTAMQ